MRARIVKNLFPSDVDGFLDINKIIGETFDIVSMNDNGDITILYQNEELRICKGEYEIISVRKELESYLRRYPLEYNLCGGSNFVSFVLEHRKDLIDILT